MGNPTHDKLEYRWMLCCLLSWKTILNEKLCKLSDKIMSLFLCIKKTWVKISLHYPTLDLNFSCHIFKQILYRDVSTYKYFFYLIRWCKLMLCLAGCELTARSWNVLQMQTLKLNRHMPRITTQKFCLAVCFISIKFSHELWHRQALKGLTFTPL